MVVGHSSGIMYTREVRYVSIYSIDSSTCTTIIDKELLEGCDSSNTILYIIYKDWRNVKEH